MLQFIIVQYNPMKNIELEYRVEIDQMKRNSLKRSLRPYLKSRDKRLTVMFWGTIKGQKIDFRVRINSNHEAEIVIKSGSFHSKDRIERSCNISIDQFESLVDILFALGLNSKVTERENFRYELKDGVSIVIVSAKHIHYLEIEKMTDKKSQKSDEMQVLSILDSYNLIPINKRGFDDLCGRLSNDVDWPYSCSDKDQKALKSMLAGYNK